jgi:hypothetical protein
VVIGTGPKKVPIYEDHQIEAISRLVASFTAIIKPHTIFVQQVHKDNVFLHWITEEYGQDYPELVE